MPKTNVSSPAAAKAADRLMLHTANARNRSAPEGVLATGNVLPALGNQVSWGFCMFEE